jgi:periplasmic protein TonB
MELKAQPSPYPRRVPEHRFWIGLSCVALLHASAIVGVGRSLPRHLGERDGSPEAISVELVDPSELGGPRFAPPTAPTNAAPPRPVAPAETGATTSPPPAPSETATGPPQPVTRAETGSTTSPPPAPSETATVASPPTPPAADAASPSFAAPIPEDKKAATSPSKKEAAALPAPADTHSPPSAAPPGATQRPPTEATGQPKTSPKLSLQLDLPPNFVAPSGLSTAAVRPPDITRSGENDEFGRRVIRALRQTMPPARGELGRVTVRLLLSATGDLSELQLVRPAADAALTQSVVFAVRQSSFPIPPTGATRSDRTFLVTYIYN